MFPIYFIPEETKALNEIVPLLSAFSNQTLRGKLREKMSTKCFVLLYLLTVCQAGLVKEADDIEKPSAGLTTYDQRQTGKYNVHVNIKDVQFFSLSDSIGSVGGDYEDYGGDYDVLEGAGNPDTDYDVSHLTVNPIYAFLGAKKTTTTIKPTVAPTSEKLPSSSTIDSTTTTTEKAETTTITSKPDSESEVIAIKPAPIGDQKPQQVSETIDYEEIPVEVQYYRANHPKSPSNGRHTSINRFHKRQPSVQIIGDGYGRASNVKIVENEPTVKICNRGEYRDAQGRCRIRTRRGASHGVPGL